MLERKQCLFQAIISVSMSNFQSVLRNPYYLSDKTNPFPARYRQLSIVISQPCHVSKQLPRMRHHVWADGPMPGSPCWCIRAYAYSIKGLKSLKIDHPTKNHKKHFLCRYPIWKNYPPSNSPSGVVQAIL